MAVDASAGLSRQLTLDHSSFEKLLEAAWVLQCLQDQLHRPEFNRDQRAARTEDFKNQIEPVSLVSREQINPPLPLSQPVSEATIPLEPLSRWPMADQTIFVPLPLPAPPAASAKLNFDSAETAAVELHHPLVAEEESRIDLPESEPPVLERLAHYNDQNWTRLRAAFTVWASEVRSVAGRSRAAFANFRPTFRLPAFRVNLTLRALRAVGIATPVWVVSLVASLIFLQVWRHESVHSAQATSRPAPPSIEAVANNVPPIVTASTRPVTEVATVPTEGRITEAQPQRSRVLPQPEASHNRITDAATQSSVQQLSQYEISGLRRRARYGDENAAFTLGMVYEVGRFVPRNCAEAARWVTTAAEAGNAAAQYNLGLRYRDGDGVQVRRGESAKWLRRAAAHRYSRANRALKMLAAR